MKNKKKLLCIGSVIFLLIIGIICLIVYGVKENREFMGKEGQEVDETGRVVKETWYLDDGKCQIMEFDYAGNVIKSTTYDKESDVEGWQEFEYDDDNNMIKMFDYEADGSYKVTEKYSTGSIKRMIVYENDGRYTVYECNEYGITETITSYDKDGNVANCDATES